MPKQRVYLADEVRKRYKDCNGSKELPSEFNDYTHSIEIHYEEEECKPILAKINFPFNPNASHLCNRYLYIFGYLFFLHFPPEYFKGRNN